MTLRLARSPEAPKRTTVQGSATPPYTEPERPESPVIVTPSAKLRAVQCLMQRSKLYLNPIFSKLGTQLFRVLMLNSVHAQAPRAFQVQRPVINEKAVLWRALSDFQSDTKDHFFGLPGANVTGTEENKKISSKVEGLNAVLI